MGLDAYVLCNCYKEGKVIEPPINPDLIIFEDNDYDLSLPYAGNEEIFSAFDSWKQTACMHKDFRFIQERISNIAGVSLFRNAMQQIESAEFPVLLSELPTVNGGETSPSEAKEALIELELFRNSINKVNVISLTTSDNIELFHSIEGSTSWFTWLGKEKLIYAINNQGFLILSEESEHILFESKEFIQEVKHNGNSKEKLEVTFLDIKTGYRYISNCPISDDHNTYPSRLHVEKKTLKKEDFAYIVEPLTRVCKASVEIGNPVVWC